MNKELRETLLRLKEEDQAPRMSSGPSDQVFLLGLSKKHVACMKQVIRKYGWPSYSLVGEDGAHAAWLLVQHADHDPEFQIMCLTLMKEAVKKGEASARNLAYLADRVYLKESGTQIYGTQLRSEWGYVYSEGIDSPDLVDQRRSEVGFEPLTRHLVTSAALYYMAYQKGVTEVWSNPPRIVQLDSERAEVDVYGLLRIRALVVTKHPQEMRWRVTSEVTDDGEHAINW